MWICYTMMNIKYHFVFIFMTVLLSTDAFLRRFGKIRKRKNFPVQNNTAVQDDLTMYYTRRSTPYPRLRVTIDPSIEAYYYRKHKKEDYIKKAYFQKAKEEKKRKIEKDTDASPRTAPALD